MDATFGSRLKAQRESQHVTLETIAERTKIRLSLLDGLERDDVSHWPSGIYRRSYLRSYAAAIGLDQEAAVREFLALYPDAIDEPEPVLDSERPGGRPPMRLQYLIASAIGAFSTRERKQDVETVPSRSNLHAVNEPGTEARPTAVQDEEPAEEFTLTAPDDFGATEPVHVDLASMATLCTRIVEAKSAADFEPLLETAAHILHAVGIIVWPWDPARGVLWPSFSHGYPRQTLARLPTLARDADNPIGAAFRSSALQVIRGSGSATSAIVVPLMTPRGCAGVLAVECASGIEGDASLQALATILAAQLSLLVNAEPIARSAIA